MTTIAKAAETDQGNAAPQEPTNSNENLDQGFKAVVAGREYTSLDDLDRKVSSQDQHISTIEGENSQLKDEIAALKAKLAEASNIEEVLDRSTNKDDNNLSAEEIKELTKEAVSEKMAEDRALDNHVDCMNAVKQAYGEKTEEWFPRIKEIAESVGLTPEDADAMAFSNPKLFKKTFLKEAKPVSSDARVPPTRVNTAANANKDLSQGKDWEAPMNLRTDKDRVNNLQKAFDSFTG